MVARYAAVDEAAARAGVLRRELIDAGERELHAYEPVLASSTNEQREEALSAASELPLAIALASTEVAELAAQVTAQSKPALKGDGAAGLLLAEAAAAAAARLVEINLHARPDDPRLAQVAALAQRAAIAREQAMREA